MEKSKIKYAVANQVDIDKKETQEWIDSIQAILKTDDEKRAQYLCGTLIKQLREEKVDIDKCFVSDYENTLKDEAICLPEKADAKAEERLSAAMRWNAMAMVVRGNKQSDGLGGHIATYASVSHLFEVGLNHFFKGKDHPEGADQVFFQAHACPGLYARAFLEGRLSSTHLDNFRRELATEGGLSSYPHPWLMPDFWEYPSVSMGLAPIMAIYQARFNRYLTNRGIKDVRNSNVWVYVGDGESDEPETLGAIRLAGREQLDNLNFVINCNLQRLDGPVFGNGKIINELEGMFRGAGWNVIKVIWSSDWDELLSKDQSGALQRVMNEVVDGEYQNHRIYNGQYIRENFFGKDPEALELVKDYTDEQLWNLRWGGHDRDKLYRAFKKASDHKGQPTVILVKTVKGYGLGSAGEAQNIAHQQKKLTEKELLAYRDFLKLDMSDKQALEVQYYKPNKKDLDYLKKRRKQLGGVLPIRQVKKQVLPLPSTEVYKEFYQGTGEHAVSTTMAFVRVLSKLLQDKGIGKRIVPIIPDEARTFGMDALFRQYGIYSSYGQTYDPVDKKNFLYYKESMEGQVLEEGISEAGGMSSFISAGTSHMAQKEPMIPFFVYYSMFGFQRVGDLIWAASDTRTRGFLLGATAGRTTLNGEGLQHQDGHSHVLASTFPSVKAYDPSFAFEIAVIIQEGLKDMWERNLDVIYYLTLGNENILMPPKPKNIEEGIIKGIYPFIKEKGKKQVALLGSGTVMKEVLEARKLIQDLNEGISVSIYSVTSYKALREDAIEKERKKLFHQESEEPYIKDVLKDEKGAIIATSDYMKMLPDSLVRWIPQLISLGTEGFGRSDSREALREHFEVDSKTIAISAISSLYSQGKVRVKVWEKAVKMWKKDGFLKESSLYK